MLTEEIRLKKPCMIQKPRDSAGDASTDMEIPLEIWILRPQIAQQQVAVMRTTERLITISDQRFVTFMAIDFLVDRGGGGEIKKTCDL